MGDVTYQPLLDQLCILAAGIPVEIVRSLADALAEDTGHSSSPDLNRITASVPQPQVRMQIKLLFDLWQMYSPGLSAQSVALALLAASNTAERYRGSESTSLVWTGPKTDGLPLRRTDQALLEVIHSAEHQLLVVSFAVYKIESIRQALVQAAERGISIRLCLEAPEPSAGKMTYDTIQALGPTVAQMATIYVWPLAQRAYDVQGRHGSFHVKCAVADEKLLFLSSANLTEYAMTLNMELGVLIRGGKLAGSVMDHFDGLIAGRVLVPMCDNTDNRADS